MHLSSGAAYRQAEALERAKQEKAKARAKAAEAQAVEQAREEEIVRQLEVRGSFCVA